MTFLRLYLWFAPNVILGLCVFFPLRRGLRARLPVFFYYCLFQLVYFFAGLAAYIPDALAHPAVSKFYYDVFIVGFGISSLFELAVLYELGDKVALSNAYLTKRIPVLFRWAGAGSLLMVVIASAVLVRPEMSRTMKVFQVLATTSDLVQIGLLLALLLFTRALSLSWRSLPAGIALGFGISASAELAAMPLLSLFGRQAYVNVDLIRMIGFHVCDVIWLVYILLSITPSPASEAATQIRQLDIQVRRLQDIMKS